MATWFKDGVLGELQPEAAEGLRKVKRLYGVRGEDLFITSKRDGSHIPESFHYTGRAWDQKVGTVSIESIKGILGDDFDVVPFEVNGGKYYHIEYDPN